MTSFFTEYCSCLWSWLETENTPKSSETQSDAVTQPVQPQFDYPASSLTQPTLTPPTKPPPILHRKSETPQYQTTAATNPAFERETAKPSPPARPEPSKTLVFLDVTEYELSSLLNNHFSVSVSGQWLIKVYNTLSYLFKFLFSTTSCTWIGSSTSCTYSNWYPGPCRPSSLRGSNERTSGLFCP